MSLIQDLMREGIRAIECCALVQGHRVPVQIPEANLHRVPR